MSQFTFYYVFKCNPSGFALQRADIGQPSRIKKYQTLSAILADTAVVAGGGEVKDLEVVPWDWTRPYEWDMLLFTLQTDDHGVWEFCPIENYSN